MISNGSATTSPKAVRVRHNGVAKVIAGGVSGLRAFPNRGRPGRVEGTRELVFAPLPFIAVYEVHDTVQVLRILHGAQQWPPA